MGEARALFEQRARAGFVRDGHGELRLEHIYRNDDGGRGDLADLLVARYAEESGD